MKDVTPNHRPNAPKRPKNTDMVNKKDWQEFRNTGLVLFINQILHVFGWAIVFEIENEVIKSVYPARVKFRGFDNKNVSDSYKDIARYMDDNSSDLLKEALD